MGRDLKKPIRLRHARISLSVNFPQPLGYGAREDTILAIDKKSTKGAGEDIIRMSDSLTGYIIPCCEDRTGTSFQPCGLAPSSGEVTSLTHSPSFEVFAMNDTPTVQQEQ